MSGRSTGPTRAVVDLVVARDEGRCAVCGGGVSGERGSDWSIQHRLRRGNGGTRRLWVNLPANLLLMHGSGTTSCHGRVESERTWAEKLGYRVVDGILLPVEVPVLHVPLGGWAMLADDGTYEVEARCPGCCCDPVLCESDDTGEHCADRSCGTCLHGCPLDGCEACAGAEHPVGAP